MNTSIFQWVIYKHAEPGDGAKTSPGLKMARMKLKISGYGNFGLGITNPVSKMSNLYLVQSYGTFVPHGLQPPPPPPPPKNAQEKHISPTAVRHFIYTPPTQFETRVIDSTPCPLYVFLRTAAVGVPKLCARSPLHQTGAAPAGELYFLLFFLLPPPPASTPAGSTPVSMITFSSTTFN